MLAEHLAYVSDPVRLERFTAAIAAVAPGARVADLGCGSGILGLLALKAGAAHAYEIDHTSMIEVARQAITRAGMADRATFIRARSQQVELPERVDVAICDHVGYFGFDYAIVELLQDARRRLLKPGGRLVPEVLHLEAGAVESPQAAKLADDWRAGHVPEEFHWLREASINAKHPVELTPAQLLGGAAALGTIDLREEQPDFYSWRARLPVSRDGVLHGIAGWFDCELAPGVRMSNSPLAERPIRRPQAFLPLEEPAALRAGDVLELGVMARPAENLLAWNVALPGGARRFSHSTWKGMLLSPEDLVRAQPDRVPRPTREGIARGIVLGYCDGKRTLREIERAVLEEHPDLFPSAAETSRFVAHVLGRDAGP